MVYSISETESATTSQKNTESKKHMYVWLVGWLVELNKQSWMLVCLVVIRTTGSAAWESDSRAVKFFVFK